MDFRGLGDLSNSDSVLKKLRIGVLLTFLILGFFDATIGAFTQDPLEIDSYQSFDQVRHCILRDAAPVYEESQGYTAPPVYGALEICESDDTDFEFMAHSPYYKVYFKESTVQMSVHDAWIEFELIGIGNGELGKESEKSKGKTSVDRNVLSVSDICESVDVSFEVETSLLTEMLVIKELQPIDRIIMNMSLGGVTPVLQEDGSILFLREDGKEIMKVLPPFMKDSGGSICTDIHYEIIETGIGYELHKVVDDKGVEWLKEAVYPVIIDPSMQTFEDAWESSGLSPYGQYFESLQEYVNPSNGHLTVTQSDFVIPGRGLDLVISRVYEMPAVFYGEDPYTDEYEASPTDVGRGWLLDFPYIGDRYVHLWGGTVYKIVWVSNVFENHTGSHFILVKNGDSTYTLTTASGIVYEFSCEGGLQSIKDLDANVITFNYTSGILTSITDTIGRNITMTYSSNQLWKIIYNGAEIEYSYNAHGCLVWMEDFLNRRTSYYYDTGYNSWLLSKIVYPTSGYTLYAYNRFTDEDYYKYYVTNQRVYETGQVRHSAFEYTGSFSGVTGVVMTLRNESDLFQGSNQFVITDGLITEKTIKNASGVAIRKYTYLYSSRKEVTEERVYNDGVNLSYTSYCGYDNWGNVIYIRNAEGHEQFFSYANTNTSGFFVDNTGNIIRKFTNAFSNSSVPSSVHTALLGAAEKQDNTYVREVYITYDSKAHPTQSKNAFGNATSYLTFSGTFNEKTSSTSFPIDLTGHTITGNGILEITGLPSDDTYQETHSYTPPYGDLCFDANWKYCSWQSTYYKVYYIYTCGRYPEINTYEGWKSLGTFTHYPGSLGYLSYSAPSCNQQSHTFSVTTNWKAYPYQTEYNLDQTVWKNISSNLQNTTAQVTIPLSDGTHTLYFSESSSQNTKFFWTLYIPVDNTVDTFTTSVTYDTYGNVTSVTDPESNTVTFSYSSDYGHAYLTEISAIVGSATLTTKATYNYYRGWITSEQAPKGVEAGSGYDVLYTYDVLGRIIKKEFPLLPHQSQRSYIEAVYDCENGTITIIDPLGHYIVREHDNLGRLTSVKTYTGQYGSGSLYAVTSYTYNYSDQVLSVTDPQNHMITYTYDLLGRITQFMSPDSSAVSYSYDDTNNKMISQSGGYERIFWFDWLSRLTKVEEEYETDLFAVTIYQYDDGSHVHSFTDAENHATHYSYGSLFGLTRITYSDSTCEEYAYDGVGNLVSRTDAEGNTTYFLYDALHRIAQIQYQDQSCVDFMYDLNSNRIRMDDNSPNLGDYSEYQYDTWNRLITETRHILNEGYTISYQYDTANRLTAMVYPDSTQILYMYDDLNRTTEIRRYIDGIDDEILLSNTQFNTENQLLEFDYGNELHATFAYDTRDRLSSLDICSGDTPYLSLDYTYDSNSNITQLINGWRNTDSNWNSDIEIYTYDGLGRLTSANCTSWSHTYSYDKAGNRISKDSTTYTINTVNEVVALSDGTTFIYDSNGNRTGKTKGNDTWVYTYDYSNRLTKVEKNSTLLGEYIYNGDGRRIQAAENGETTTYIYSGLNILYEENTTGTAAYIYGPTGRLVKRTTIQDETHSFYYCTDHQGSTRLVADESRSIITDVLYEPFGESSITGEESYLYTGKEKDATGLYYYGARYYDPELGTFITRDPLPGRRALPQSLNRYTYCLNNPVNLIDPAGLETSPRMCNGNDICIRFTDDGWIAYDTNGNVITTSQEMDSLLDPTGKTEEQKIYDQARAAYLMLLVTHPEIQGDSDQGDPQSDLKTPVMIDGDTTWFDYEVEVNGSKQTVRIGISTENFTIETNYLTGESGKVYATTNDLVDGNKRVIKVQVYQFAFVSVARLFHIIGHEGVHVIQYNGGGSKNLFLWEKIAWAWTYAHVWVFPWDLVPPPGVDPL